MTSGGPARDLQLTLQVMVVALEQGLWRSVLGEPSRRLSHCGSGSTPYVGLVAVCRQAAASMQDLACGHLDHAWQLLQEVADMLPPSLVRVDARTGERRAVRTLVPGGPDVPSLTSRIAAVVWREQTELAELRDRFAPDRATARDVLTEAAVQFMIWVDFDHAAFYSVTAGPGLMGHDPTTVDRDRRTLLRRATLLRQFAYPRAGDVTSSVWQDIGKWRGLRAAAHLSLGLRTPASCCSATSVPVRLARIAARRDAEEWLQVRALLGTA